MRNPFLRTEKARAFGLYWVLVDQHLPYFKLPSGARMSNEDFAAARRRLRTSIMRINFILVRKFDQRTERADLLVQELDAAKGMDKCILMAEIVDSKKLASVIDGLTGLLK